MQLKLFSFSCDNCEKLKREMPRLRQLFQNEAQFKMIYQFSFDFSKVFLPPSLPCFSNGATLLFTTPPLSPLLTLQVSELANSRHDVGLVQSL